MSKIKKISQLLDKLSLNLYIGTPLLLICAVLCGSKSKPVTINHTTGELYVVLVSFGLAIRGYTQGVACLGNRQQAVLPAKRLIFALGNFFIYLGLSLIIQNHMLVTTSVLLMIISVERHFHWASIVGMVRDNFMITSWQRSCYVATKEPYIILLILISLIILEVLFLVRS